MRPEHPRTIALAVLIPIMINFVSTNSYAQNIAIIGHNTFDYPPINTNTIKQLFRRKLQANFTGQALIPLNLPASHPLRITFSNIVLKRSPKAMERYWNEQYFHGISPPFVLASTEAMLRFIENTPGAVGYVLDCQTDDRVNVLLLIDLPQQQSEQLQPLCNSSAKF